MSHILEHLLLLEVWISIPILFKFWTPWWYYFALKTKNNISGQHYQLKLPILEIRVKLCCHFIFMFSQLISCSKIHIRDWGLIIQGSAISILLLLLQHICILLFSVYFIILVPWTEQTCSGYSSAASLFSFPQHIYLCNPLTLKITNSSRGVYHHAMIFIPSLCKYICIIVGHEILTQFTTLWNVKAKYL